MGCCVTGLTNDRTREAASATDERSRRNGNAWGSSLLSSGSRIHPLERAATAAAAVIVDERKSENFLERKK